MSVGTIFSNSLSALQASQNALSVVSQNIANANTPGYVRAEVNLSTRAYGGVDVASITRAANRFLAAATHSASSTRGAAQAQAELLDRAQGAFGDPNSDNTLFSSLDSVFSAFSDLAVAPTSAIERNNSITALDRLFGDIASVGREIESLRIEADARIGETAIRINGYLTEIAARNRDVAHLKVANGDTTAVENARDQIIDELSELIDVRVQVSATGIAEVRTQSGALLVNAEPKSLTFTQSSGPYGAGGSLLLNAGSTDEVQLEPLLRDGAIKGLIEVRDNHLPALGDALGEFAGVLADSLNAIHSTTAGAPPASSFVGRQTGLLGSDSLNFSGSTILALVDDQGVLTQRITIDFDAETITSEQSGVATAVTNFGPGATIEEFATSLDAVANIDAEFDGGVFTVGGSRIVFDDPAVGGSDRGGRSFAHFFGLNDLVRSDSPSFFDAGVSETDAHGIAAGGSIAIRVKDALGRVVADRSVTPSGPLWSDLRADLNDPVSGVGGFVTAGFDAASGRLTLSPNSGYTFEVVGDTTRRSGTPVSVSALFGLDRASTAGRALALDVSSDVRATPSRLGLGEPDVTGSLGGRVVEVGDSRGAQALSALKNTNQLFAQTGLLSGGVTTLAQFGASLAGLAATLSTTAENANAGAEAVLEATTERRAQSESVSVDDELLKMTQYQQSYAAAARLLQAAKEMFDSLLNLI